MKPQAIVVDGQKIVECETHFRRGVGISLRVGAIGVEAAVEEPTFPGVAWITVPPGADGFTRIYIPISALRFTGNGVVSMLQQPAKTWDEGDALTDNQWIPFADASGSLLGDNQ